MLMDFVGDNADRAETDSMSTSSVRMIVVLPRGRLASSSPWFARSFTGDTGDTGLGFVVSV